MNIESHASGRSFLPDPKLVELGMLVAQADDVGLFKLRFNGKLAVRGELLLLCLCLRNGVGQRSPARHGFADAAG